MKFMSGVFFQEQLNISRSHGNIMEFPFFIHLDDSSIGY